MLRPQVIHGEVQLKSNRFERFNGRTWVDGAFIGELPMLGMGAGPLRNRHIYSTRPSSRPT